MKPALNIKLALIVNESRRKVRPNLGVVRIFVSSQIVWTSGEHISVTRTNSLSSSSHLRLARRQLFAQMRRVVESAHDNASISHDDVAD